MFVHAVLFEIQPKEVLAYRRDCKMWAAYARKAKGFMACFTMRREGHKNQFVSVYIWKANKVHASFMGKFHDLLVGKSKAKVEVLGYYNLKSIYELR